VDFMKRDFDWKLFEDVKLIVICENYTEKEDFKKVAYDNCGVGVIDNYGYHICIGSRVEYAKGCVSSNILNMSNPVLKVVKWSDYMKENLKEKYLVDRAIVAMRSGARGMVIGNRIMLANGKEYTYLSEFYNNLQHETHRVMDIVRVFPEATIINDLTSVSLRPIWNREEYEKPQVKEYTMEELNEKLGETIKIVEKH